MKRWKIILVIALVVLVALIAVMAVTALSPAAPQQNAITWQVVASGGSVMSSSTYTMISTSGQPAVGSTSGSSWSVMSGFWQALSRLLLPVVID
jgi:hypothetical protein